MEGYKILKAAITMIKGTCGRLWGKAGGSGFRRNDTT